MAPRWSPDALPEGPDNLIERMGHRFARGSELLRARMPSHEEARQAEQQHRGHAIVEQALADWTDGPAGPPALRLVRRQRVRPPAGIPRSVPNKG